MGVKRKHDLIGKRFGELLVLASTRALVGHKDVAGWFCQCSCGIFMTLSTGQLTSGGTLTCGCRKLLKGDLIGQTFGRLTAIFNLEKTVNHGKLYLCKCRCGRFKIVASEELKDGRVQSCGCLQKENYTELCRLAATRRRKALGVGNMGVVICSYRTNARNRGLEFNLTREQMINLFSRDCFYCGRPPSNIMNRKTYNGAFMYSGIDRVDSNKGYTIDNVVSCCAECNWSKRKRSYKEFTNWIKKIVLHLKLFE